MGWGMRATLAAALCATVAGPSAADDGPPDTPAAPGRPEENPAFLAEVATTFAPFVPKLEALGQWCETSTLLAQRARVAEALVLLSPENEHGRAWLRWKRQKDGSWRQASTKPFFDEKTELLPEWQKRRAEVADPLRDSLSPLLERKEDWRTAGPRDRILRALIAMRPDDADLRAANGEVLVSGKWLLSESSQSAAGRKRIAAAAAEADREALKASKDFLRPPSPFASSAGTQDFTLYATLPEADATALAARVVAARLLVERVLDVRVHHYPRLVIRVFASHPEAMRYLDTRTDVREDRRAFAKRCLTSWFSGSEFFVSADDPASRLDECVRQVLATLGGDVVELTKAPAWIGEGFGMYLTQALVGTRLTPFVKPSEYSDTSLAKELSDPKSDWVAAIRKQVIEKGVAPNLPILASLPLNSMTKDDTLMSYALAAYFLEGRPSDSLALLRDLKDKRSFHRALAECCNVDAAGLETRFVRWLRETK